MRHWKLGSAAVAVVVASAACGGGGLVLPEPRPLVIQSGARLSADEARLMGTKRGVPRPPDLGCTCWTRRCLH